MKKIFFITVALAGFIYAQNGVQEFDENKYRTLPETPAPISEAIRKCIVESDIKSGDDYTGKTSIEGVKKCIAKDMKENNLKFCSFYKDTVDFVGRYGEALDARSKYFVEKNDFIPSMHIFEIYDYALNKIYKQALEQISDIEKEGFEAPYAHIKPGSFRNSQRAWLSMKEAFCPFADLESIGVLSLSTECAIQLTKNRITEIREYICTSDPH